MKPKHTHKWGKWDVDADGRSNDPNAVRASRWCQCGAYDFLTNRQVNNRLNRDENGPRYVRVGTTDDIVDKWEYNDPRFGTLVLYGRIPKTRKKERKP